MEYRSLGRSGLKVSALGFGNMVSGWTEDTEQWSFECIDKCIRAGVNLFDTAEIYGFGIAERVLGNNLKQGGWDRDDLIISDKLNPTGFGIQGLSRKRIRQATRNALERLQLDYVDILFLHRFDHEVPLKEQISAINQMIEEDKTFYWGTSEFTPQQLIECHKICEKYGYSPPIVEQCQYNMFHRETFERDYVTLYDKYGMGTTTWSPLASGLLTGKYNDGEMAEGSRFATASFAPLQMFWNMMMVEKKESTLKTLKGLEEISKELGVTQAQLAVAWCVANKDNSCTLLGASKPQQLDELLQTIEISKQLTPEVSQKIEDVLENRPVPSMYWRGFTTNPPRR